MFHVGQKVVCVDGLEQEGIFTSQIYTISKIRIIADFLFVGLVEVRSPSDKCDVAWFATRFRPLTSNDTKISFTEGAPKDSERWDGRRKQREHA
jgi:hypothetical protein